jgi:hypothetical protein
MLRLAKEKSSLYRPASHYLLYLGTSYKLAPAGDLIKRDNLDIIKSLYITDPVSHVKFVPV